MMAMFFAQRVLLNKASFDPAAPSAMQIPSSLKQQVADILLESGMAVLVPIEYGGSAQFD